MINSINNWTMLITRLGKTSKVQSAGNNSVDYMSIGSAFSSQPPIRF